MAQSRDLQDYLFSYLMRRDFAPYFQSGKVAVAVSGGPDSMALALALSKYAQVCGDFEIHALTVDHSLRPESWQEAEAVHQMMNHWPHLQHHILKWEGVKPSERIQELARAARYRLIEEYCRAQNIDGVFLAHHQGDQAETFLLRLAGGSGLNGLGGMKPVHDRGGLMLLRPFLPVTKDDLVCFCAQENIAYFTDPSNNKEQFARVRLRHARSVLEQEGLSDKRLFHTAYRLGRARQALEKITDEKFEGHVIFKDTGRFDFNFGLLSEPDEIILRIVKKAMQELRSDDKGFGPREEKLECLIDNLIHEDAFRKRTLGGVIFEKNTEAAIIRLSREG